MGHKAHPIGLRLGIHRKWKSNWFFESKNYPKFVHLNLNIEKFFRGFLYFRGIRTLLLNCQLIKLPSNQLFIFIFHYRFRKKLKKNFYKWRLRKWQENLEKFFLYKKADLTNNSKLYYAGKHDNLFLKKFIINVASNNSTSLPKNFFIEKEKSYLKSKKNLNINFENILNLYNQLTFNLKKYSSLKKTNNEELLLNHLHKLKLKWSLLRSLIIFLKKNYIKNNLKFFVNKWFFLKKNHLKFYNFFYFRNFLIKKNMISQDVVFFQRSLKYYWTVIKKVKSNLKFFDKFLKKSFFKLYKKRKHIKKIKKNRLITKKSYFHSIANLKKFLSKITNMKINLIFINALSFTKFFYIIGYIDKKDDIKKREKYNVLQIQRNMINRYKYSAIFIKDFVHLAFISVLLKNTSCLVKFMGEQFKRLPKNRKQFRLLKFLQQSLKIFCKQRKEFIGFKLQIKGRLNRRNRTHKWTFNQGILPMQTHTTRIEYGYSEGLTRSGLIGIKLWFFYKRQFKNVLKSKLMQYLYYSKYKKKLNKNLIKKFIKKYPPKSLNFSIKNNLNLSKKIMSVEKKSKVNVSPTVIKNVKTESTKISKK